MAWVVTQPKLSNQLLAKLEMRTGENISLICHSFYLINFLQVSLVRVDSPHHAASEPDLGHGELCLAQLAVPHLPHQVSLVPASQVGGRQWAVRGVLQHSHLYWASAEN